MSELAAPDWHRPTTSQSLIFDAVSDLRLRADPVDHSTERSAVAMGGEVGAFSEHVEAFHARMSRNPQPNGRPVRRFSIVSPFAREPIVDYTYYELGRISFSFMIYSAINHRGQIVVGERLNVFDDIDRPYHSTTSLTRANRHVPGAQRSILVPTTIAQTSPATFENIYKRIRSSTEQLLAAQCAGETTLRVITSVPDESVPLQLH